MKCAYCLKQSDNLINEHFIPKSLGGNSKTRGKEKNVFKSCIFCDRAKRRAAFWSIKSFREFLKIKGKRPSYTFSKFLRDKVKKIISIKEKRELLCRVLAKRELKKIGNLI